MTPAPQTIDDETAAALNALIAESDRFRSWGDPKIQELVRITEKLQKVDARAGFVRRGFIAAICGEIDLMDEFFRKALMLPGEVVTKAELYAALGNAGMYARAHEIGAWLLDPRRGFFPATWERAVSLGQIRAVWSNFANAKKAYPELADAKIDVVEQAASVMLGRNLTDEEIALVFDQVGVIQRTHRIMFNGSLISTLKVMRPPEDPPYLYFSIALDTDVAEVHQMNRELSAVVIEHLPNGAFPLGVVASFSRAKEAKFKAAA